MTWVASADDSDCAASDVTGDDGLEATGFTLVESDVDSGIFTGSFQVPTNFCWTDGASGDTDSVKGVTGTDIEVNYNDFRFLLLIEGLAQKKGLQTNIHKYSPITGK
jgi:hypothetical protein